MAELWIRKTGETTTSPVTDINPLPIEVVSLPAGETFDTDYVTVPGIVAGAAYATGDAMGTRFQLPVPTAGYITTVLTVDLDKEQLDFDVLLFRQAFAPTADNAAMDVADTEHHRFTGHISVLTTHYAALNDSAVATTRLAPPLHYYAPAGYLWVQLVTRGAPNYTAADDLRISLRILPD
jgi:hypothetical protein